MPERLFADRLLDWYGEYGRKDLPWQQQDAYRVWVSEIMLQQTQVTTVIPYYERFIARFPDVGALADAPVDAVLGHWSGLGYYARARNLHKAAAMIRDDFGGEFPRHIDEVLRLPGIGASTAGAILALAFGQRHPILDGNAKRVLARHGAIGGWPGKTAVQKELWAAAEQHTPENDVAKYTQAIMDLGATLCTRSSPSCERCPVASDCKAYRTGRVADYPGRKPGKDKPLRQTTMLLAVNGDALYLERRPPAGIWGGLWSLPEVDDASIEDWCRARFARGSVHESWGLLRHSFSHYDLDIRPIVVRVAGTSAKVAEDDDAAWMPLDSDPPGGIAAPVMKLIEQLRRSNDVT